MGKIGEEYIYLPPPPTVFAQIFKLLTGQSLRAMHPLLLAAQLGQGRGGGAAKRVNIVFTLLSPYQGGGAYSFQALLRGLLERGAYLRGGVLFISW